MLKMTLKSLKMIIMYSFMIYFLLISLNKHLISMEIGKIFLDFYSFLMLFLTIIICIMIMIAFKKMDYMFIIIYMFLNMILLLFFMMKKMMMFYILFELSLIPIFLIIMKWGYQPERIISSFYMMMYTIIGSLPILIFIIWFPMNFFSFFYSMKLSTIIFLLSTWGFFMKLPSYLFHIWLPKAHVEAPTPGSMILASVLLKMGGMGMIRMFGYFKCLISKQMNLYLMFCLWGGLLISYFCINMLDTKILIAYSSVVHMCFIPMVIWNNMLISMFSCNIIMFSHGVCSSSMFFICGMIFYKSSSRMMKIIQSQTYFSKYFFLLLFLTILCNIGVPPTLNFLGEVLTFFSLIINKFIFISLFFVMMFFVMLYSIYFFIFMNQLKNTKYIKEYIMLSMMEKMLIFMHFNILISLMMLLI